jgi:hypothetical protein
MNNTFFDVSKEIANDYLQSIVFLDDRALPKNSEKENEPAEQNLSQHAFDTFEVSKVFAKEKKICAVYNPFVDTDIDDFIQISKKADVVILDWFITLDENESKTTKTDDEDVDVDDPRGKYTKKIIKELVNDHEFGSDSLKLIIVYTGEVIIEDISENIYNEINSDVTPFKLHQKECKVQSKNIKILIRCKSQTEGEDTRFNQRPYLKDKVLQYGELPTFVLNEFTEMTCGLLSNFALLSLSTIRRNSHKILSLFSKELDTAYLGHKSLLPYPNDAEDMLVDLMKDSIGDLLAYNKVGDCISDITINNWLDKYIIEEELSVLNKKSNQYDPDVIFLREKKLLKSLLISNETKVEKRLTNNLKDSIKDTEKRKTFIELLSINSTYLFLNKSNQANNESVNKNFARLTQHKSLFLPKPIAPRLTLGTLIQSKIDKSSYFICIQQKCDSLRIQKGVERKFLFLPLKMTENKRFDILTPDGIKMELAKKSFSIRTLKFKCNSDDGVILGVKNEEQKYIFKQIYEDEEFEWVLDLKDLHSQRIVSNYAAQLSRVGLDESEWLRRSSGDNEED